MCIKTGFNFAWDVTYWYFTICFAFLNLLLQSHIFHYATVPMVLLWMVQPRRSHFCFATLGCNVLHFFYKIVMKAIHNTPDFFTNNMFPVPLSVITALLPKATFTCSSIISIRCHCKNEKASLVLAYEHFFFPPKWKCGFRGFIQQGWEAWSDDIFSKCV